jgi:hypothetical protein
MPWQDERLAIHTKAKKLPADVLAAFDECAQLFKKYDDRGGGSCGHPAGRRDCVANGGRRFQGALRADRTLLIL